MKKFRRITVGILTAVMLFGFSVPVHALVHTVSKGESLFKISRRYGTTVAELKANNSLSGNTIYPGQKLQVNSSSSTSSRSSRSYNQDDLYWLARAVYAEARGEPHLGQVAVAAVILNRVRHKDFPDTVKGVIFEPLAFTCVADKQIYLEPNTTAIQAARAALAGEDPS